MQEGLLLALGGTNTVAVLGLLAKVWLANRPTKIQQPLEVRAADESTPKAQCEERHGKLDDQVANLFGRVAAVERTQAAHDAQAAAMKTQLASMDAKLDTLLKRNR